MEILTDATLSKLLAECAKYENYIGAILFESRDREAEFLNEIKSLGNDWTINVRLGRIKCKNNNSHIYTFTINRNFEEKIRGMEFNSMLLDGACGADDVVVISALPECMPGSFVGQPFQSGDKHRDDLACAGGCRGRRPRRPGWALLNGNQ